MLNQRCVCVHACACKGMCLGLYKCMCGYGCVDTFGVRGQHCMSSSIIIYRQGLLLGQEHSYLSVLAGTDK